MLDRALSERWWTQRQAAQGVVQKAQAASPALGSVLAQDVLWWRAVTISITKSGGNGHW